ncbi:MULTISPECIES: EF-hand domain-containing protein [Streptomyces]|uniref:EF-hand domain-containing protein n=1 Tax=Streptomyces TaxID=1883 RepID=UPI001F35551D|nr:MULTISPECIES: EF-hand domain-containing protein [Streptomyces]
MGSLFDLADANGDGALDRAEIARLRRVLGNTAENAATAFDAVDTDADGRISQDEYISSIRAFVGEGASPMYEAVVATSGRHPPAPGSAPGPAPARGPSPLSWPDQTPDRRPGYPPHGPCHAAPRRPGSRRHQPRAPAAAGPVRMAVRSGGRPRGTAHAWSDFSRRTGRGQRPWRPGGAAGCGDAELLGCWVSSVVA